MNTKRERLVKHYLPLNKGTIFQTLTGPSCVNWPILNSIKKTGMAPKISTVKYGMIKAPKTESWQIVELVEIYDGIKFVCTILFIEIFCVFRQIDDSICSCSVSWPLLHLMKV